MKLYGITRWVCFAASLSVSIGLMNVQAEEMQGDSGMSISPGKAVSLEYTLKLEEGKVVDTNVGAAPLIYTHGSKQIVPGLENALEGMTVGESKEVTVVPEQGYGPVREEAFREISKEKIPPEAQKVGAPLEAKDDNGRVMHLRVAEVKEETVVVDFNHPLAGKTLYFEVKVLEIKPGQAQE